MGIDLERTICDSVLLGFDEAHRELEAHARAVVAKEIEPSNWLRPSLILKLKSCFAENAMG